MKKAPVKIYFFPVFMIAFLIFSDQITKYLITQNFELHESRPVIKNIFHITYIQNTGMAWGMLQGKRLFFLIFTIPVLILFAYMYHNIAPEGGKFRVVKGIIICVMAGAAGNMIDRIRLSYVVDFLDFTCIDFPVFNVADILVTCGLILFFILSLWKLDNEDFDKMFRFRRY